jgi:hypothetical protein
MSVAASDGASNMALERPAGSHSLAAAAHCQRSPHGRVVHRGFRRSRLSWRCGECRKGGADVGWQRQRESP